MLVELQKLNNYLSSQILFDLAQEWSLSRNAQQHLASGWLFLNYQGVIYMCLLESAAGFKQEPELEQGRDEHELNSQPRLRIKRDRQELSAADNKHATYN